MASGAIEVCAEARNLFNIKDKYKCEVCSRILREPMQLNCGHRCCRSCAQLRIQQSKIVCPKCSETTNQEKMYFDKGFINDMENVSTQCSQCGWTGKLTDYEAHHLQERQNPSCEFCREQFDSVVQLDYHKSHYSEQATVYCLCCLSSIPHGQFKEHLASSEHRRAQAMKDRRAQGSTNVSNTVESQSEDARDEIETLSDDLQVINTVQSLKGITGALTKGVATLNPSVPEQNAPPSTQNTIEIIDINEVLRFIQNLESASNVSSNRVFTWKIQQFSEKMLDAKEQRRTCICSPSFYSHENGYKVRARLYPRGNGNGRETHISIFLVLKKGPHDGTLRFPFDYKVTCCLYDQSGERQHIIESFRPDIQSNSFQRPATEANIGSGIPKFVPLSIIEQWTNPYIQDDTMYIKILLHTHSESNLFLAYSLDMNPRLSLDDQEDILKKFVRNFDQRVCILCDICSETINYPNSVVCYHQLPKHLVVVSANGNSLT